MIEKFLVIANQKGYASEDAEIVKEVDGSNTIIFELGDFKDHDNFFGGEPYGGRRVVFYKGKPVWMMVYYGAVVPRASHKRIYKFLRSALRKGDNPFRGPAEMQEGNLVYEFSYEGDIAKFNGEENILQIKGLDCKVLYSATFFGGLIDLHGE